MLDGQHDRNSIKSMGQWAFRKFAQTNVQRLIHITDHNWMLCRIRITIASICVCIHICLWDGNDAKSHHKSRHVRAIGQFFFSISPFKSKNILLFLTNPLDIYTHQFFLFHFMSFILYKYTHWKPFIYFRFFFFTTSFAWVLKELYDHNNLGIEFFLFFFFTSLIRRMP